jgi:exodeoxyribonuclease VII large subunit
VSPLASLDRGYAIVSDATGHVVQDATRAQRGDVIEARLARGRLKATVIEIVPAADRTV